jgi:hypothetical protein
MFQIGSSGRKDGSLSQEAACAPHAILRATPALPGRVYTLSEITEGQCYLEFLKFMSTLSNIQAVTIQEEKMSKPWKVTVLSLLIILTACCIPPSPTNGESPLPSPPSPESPLLDTPPVTYPAPDVEKGMGVISGKIIGPSSWRGKEVYVYAAPFYNTEGEDGFYVLEPSIHPGTLVGPEGRFQLNVPEGEYVIIAGPSPEEGIVFQKSGRPEVFRITAGQTLDLGTVNLALP